MDVESFKEEIIRIAKEIYTENKSIDPAVFAFRPGQEKADLIPIPPFLMKFSKETVVRALRATLRESGATASIFVAEVGYQMVDVNRGSVSTGHAIVFVHEVVGKAPSTLLVDIIEENGKVELRDKDWVQGVTTGEIANLLNVEPSGLDRVNSLRGLVDELTELVREMDDRTTEPVVDPKDPFFDMLADKQADRARKFDFGPEATPPPGPEKPEKKTPKPGKKKGE